MKYKFAILFVASAFLLCLLPGIINAQPPVDEALLRMVFTGGQRGELQPCG